MLARVQSYLLHGIDALGCEVEVDYDDTDINGHGAIVGLPDAAVKESLDRVGAALSNSGYGWPRGKVLINMAPADVRKEGPVYDLPIAVGLLMVQGIVPTHAPKRGSLTAPDPPGLDHRRMIFAGELALDGRVRPIKGAIALASMARERGAAGLVVPRDNAQEAAVVDGLCVYGVGTLAELVGLLNGHLEAQPQSPIDVGSVLRNAAAPVDFAEIRGQEGVKRAVVIAAAGLHNLLQLWPSAGHGGRRNSIRIAVPHRALGHNPFQLWLSGGVRAAPWQIPAVPCVRVRLGTPAVRSSRECERSISVGC